MPSTKRKSTRRKANDMNDTSEVELPESSPTKTSPVKRRKVATTRAVPAKRRSSPSGDDESESEELSNTDLVESVISYLQVAKDPIAATIDHSNEKKHEKVSAFAKIAGRDWTYFIVDQVVNIGRPPDPIQRDASVAASSPAPEKEVPEIQVDLGPSKIISRHHAEIFYDSERPKGGGWHVRVIGRNGVRVNNHLLKKDHTRLLNCGDILEIAGTQMMFVTPTEEAIIDQSFIDRAQRMATGEDWMEPAKSEPARAPNTGPASRGQALAPAPPGYVKGASSPGKGGKGQVFDSKQPMSPLYGRGMMMESTTEIDYSKDSAKDLKPPFSYATMIAQAIFASDEEKLTLANIYSWIADRYAFYRHSNSGWQNSIRHNLSLNKAFQKVPRRTDEPGKGMKWMIAPDHRDEYWKKQSPITGKEVNPNFRGPNGQNLGYDQSMVQTFSAISTAQATAPPPTRRDIKYNLFGSSSQHPSSDTFTPDRRRMGSKHQPNALEDSPVPHRHHSHPSPVQPPPYTLPHNHALPQIHPSSPLPSRSDSHTLTNPTLSSSYIDTPFRSSTSLLTPAPLRQNPRLAPPSTLVAPSKFMPESSPAAPGTSGLFWKGLMGFSGDGQGMPELSPIKREDFGRGIMSSSPPPMVGADEHGSPSKKARRSPVNSQRQSQGHPEPQNGSTINGGHYPAHQQQQSFPPPPRHEEREEDENGGMGGFDLARGFAPIGAGSFSHSQSHAGSYGPQRSGTGVARAQS